MDGGGGERADGLRDSSGLEGDVVHTEQPSSYERVTGLPNEGSVE